MEVVVHSTLPIENNVVFGTIITVVIVIVVVVVGDCGLIVVRHIDSETAGYMRERKKPRHLRKNDLRVAYLSQQQLRGFNLPYQLGHIPPKGSTDQQFPDFFFENPSDADTASIPVMVGDLIIMATDGLFDNVDLGEL